MPNIIATSNTVSCPVLEPGINAYSWGHLSGYNDTPPTDVEVPICLD